MTALAPHLSAYSTPSRTPFHAEGGQRSILIADTGEVS